METGAFLQEASDPFQEAREWKKGGAGKVLAYLLPDVPEEIIHASGIYPFPLLHMKRRPALSEGIIPSFLCPIVRNPLEMAMEGELDFVDGIVIPYTCDTTRAFSHVWENLFPTLFSHTLWLPKKDQGPAARAFLHSEFVRLKKQIEGLANRKISDDDLRYSISMFNGCRQRLRELFRRKAEGASCLPYSGFMEIVKRAMFMPTREKNHALPDLAHDVAGEAAPPGESARVFLSGAVCDSYDLLRGMEEVGLEVVDDDLYNGTRYFLQDVNEGGDPIEALVERHLARDPLSIYHYPKERWIHHLTNRVKGKNIQGFIFLTPKYCDPVQFDYPFIRELLHAWGIPVLYLETDFPAVVDAGLRTRLEAFAEMVKG